MRARSAEIHECVTRSLAMRGWREQDLCGLGSAFARDGDVSPYFEFGRVVARVPGIDRIEGMLGIVCRSFEAVWAENLGGADNGHCVMAHSANFPQLGEASFLHVDRELETQVQRYCSCLDSLLSSFPSSCAALREALSGNGIAGFSLHQLASFRQPAKFRAFEAYILNMPS